MTANPVRVGRILEHGQDWRFFRLDRAAAALQRGDVIRVRPFDEGEPFRPFRTGECRVLSTFADFVHVERGAWQDIVAIADMDHVYLTERHKITADPTVPPSEARFAQPCGIGSTHHTHRCERPAGHAGVHVGRGCSWGEDAVEKLPGGGSSTFSGPYWIGEDEMQAETPRVVTTCPGWNGVFSIEPDPPDLAERQAARVAEHQEQERRSPFDYDVPRYDGILKAPYEQTTRPDGFAQHHVDAAKAALLAPAPPRYPRAR